MSDTRYEAVLWDIGGVLVELASVRAGYAAFVAELADAHDLDREAALATWRETLGEHFRGREGTAYRPAREGYRTATAALFDGDPPDGWQRTFERATGAALRPVDGAVGTVERLADLGVAQAIVSDIDTREAETALATLGIRDRVAHVTTSEAVGFTKPDERMFRDALAALDVAPDAALLVGDRYEHDVAGAAAVRVDAAAFGADARGPAATHELDDLRDLPGVVAGRGA